MILLFSSPLSLGDVKEGFELQWSCTAGQPDGRWGTCRVIQGLGTKGWMHVRVPGGSRNLVFLPAHFTAGLQLCRLTGSAGSGGNRVWLPCSPHNSTCLWYLASSENCVLILIISLVISSLPSKVLLIIYWNNKWRRGMSRCWPSPHITLRLCHLLKCSVQATVGEPFNRLPHSDSWVRWGNWEAE